MKSKLLSLLILVSTSLFAQNEVVKDSVKSKTNELNEVQVYGNKKQFLKIESDKKNSILFMIKVDFNYNPKMKKNKG